ncbi:class A beta-lactamase-related serine hydrolase [Alteromonadaceae bacterium M269]|nr:class A beta-lactamase-related serine hydrolase [Alteromonadaceae bacterium M269]
MKIQLLILLVCIICVPKSAAKGDNQGQHQNTQIIQDYEQQLTKLLKSLNEVSGVPGFSVAVMHKGELIASVATGFSDLSKKITAEPDTTFRLASVSKVIGATMLAELVVNGQLDPDLSIGHYYPELNPKYHSITLRQLLSHTSGMPHYQSIDHDIYDHFYTSAIEAATTLKDRDLLSTPGHQYLYSTHGYTLAGALYEKITKQPLPKSVEDFIRRWTGRETPAIENIHNLNKSSTKLYELNQHGAKEIAYEEKSYSIFGTGFYASSSDLASFGAQVLKRVKADKKYHRLLFTPTETQDGNIVTDRRFQVGFGWRISEDSYGRTVYHHAGATPGARSILAIYPEHDLSIAFLSNSSWISSIDNLVFALASLYLDEAKAMEIDRTKYHISYQGQQLKGTTACQENQCFLTDNTTNYAHWLNTFNADSQPVNQWPTFLYSVGQDQRLLMVNKVGITAFDGKGNVFELKTGKFQSYSIQLLNTE